MAHPSLRARTQPRQPKAAIEENWDDEKNDDFTQDFDVALHLANHAQRLKNVDTSVEQLAQSLRNLQGFYIKERTRQHRLMGIMAACLVATIAAVALWPKSSGDSSTAPALPTRTQYQPQQPVLMPQAMQTYSQPVITQNSQRPNAIAPNPIAPNPIAMGARYDQQQQRNAQAYLAPPPQQQLYMPPRPAPVVQLSPFQSYVQSKLTARGETIPSDWQTFFDREARGDKKGKLLVAAKFLKGEGVSRDQTLAVEMIRQAADAGEKEAMMWLAYANQGGNIGKTDINAAIRWFQAAGKAGVAAAYTELGRIYETGADGAPDIETAIAWYQRGAQAGDAKAAEALNRINSQQTQFQQPQIQAPSFAPQPSQQIQQLINQPMTDNAPLAAPSTPSNNIAANNTQDVFVPASGDISVSSAYTATPVVASVPTPAPASQMGLNKAQAKADNTAIQSMLRTLGYPIDRVDGEYGPQTASAIKAYQRDRSIYPDGEPSAELIEALSRETRAQ